MDIRYHNVTVDFPSHRSISYCSASTVCVAVTAQLWLRLGGGKGSSRAGQGKKNVLLL